MRAPPADPRSFSEAGHLGVVPGPVRHRMGLRSVPADDWLEPDEHRTWQLEQKAMLVAADRDRYVLPAECPAAERAAVRLRQLLRDEAGLAVTDDDEPIVACGLATQEDWCVMVREDAWRLRAACLCFPSRWVLAEKAGGTVAEIHAPVPRYADELGGVVESFLDRLGPERIVARANWNLWDDAALSQPFTDADAPAHDLPSTDEVGERVFLRVERQTLRRLADDAIAFSIRVHQRPLDRVAAQPGALPALRRAVDDPRATAKLGRLAGPVRAWFAER